MRRKSTRAEEDKVRQTRRLERLARFQPMFRNQIAALTSCSSHAEDLTESFPGLLIALVSNFGTQAKRSEAFGKIVDGGSIKTAAEILGLPMWLRKMPPEAFREPIRQLPAEAQFTARIGNFIPQKLNSTGEWLETVSLAGAACNGDFALWVAKHCGAVSASRRKYLFLPMAAWAWHANQPETTGYRLIEHPWSPAMGIRRATEALARWRRRADLACLLDDGIESPWLQGGVVGSYTFVPLMTVDDFLGESKIMSNCLDQYADRLGTGLIRIFSIRQGDRRVADIEIGPPAAHETTPSIVQIKGPHNRQAPLAVWLAAQNWLEDQARESLPRRPGAVRRDESASSFWQPYLKWLPEHLSAEFETRFVANRRRQPRQHLRQRFDAALLARRLAIASG